MSPKSRALWAALLSSALIGASASGLPARPGSRISLPAGAGLEAVVRALSQSAVGAVVVAEGSGVPATLRTALDDAPFEAALRQVSLDFDRVIVRRGKTLALQLRYSDPREDSGLEIEELRQVAVEMDRLMTPFRPPFEGLSYINAQAAFVA